VVREVGAEMRNHRTETRNQGTEGRGHRTETRDDGAAMRNGRGAMRKERSRGVEWRARRRSLERPSLEVVRGDPCRISVPPLQSSGLRSLRPVYSSRGSQGGRRAAETACRRKARRASGARGAPLGNKSAWWQRSGGQAVPGRVRISWPRSSRWVASRAPTAARDRSRPADAGGPRRVSERGERVKIPRTITFDPVESVCCNAWMSPSLSIDRSSGPLHPRSTKRLGASSSVL
jgi:hypothetical protein